MDWYLQARSVDLNLTGRQMRVMGFIAHRSHFGDVYQKDVESELNIRGSSVTSLLGNLEKHGFISRESAADDARFKRVVLTEKGMKIHERAWQNIVSLNGVMLFDMSGEEVGELKRLLKKAFDNVKAANASFADGDCRDKAGFTVNLK